MKKFLTIIALTLIVALSTILSQTPYGIFVFSAVAVVYVLFFFVLFLFEFSGSLADYIDKILGGKR